MYHDRWEVKSAAPAAVAPSDRADIQYGRDQKKYEIEAFDRYVIVDHPCVQQRGEGKKDEPQDQDQQVSMEGPAEVGSEEEKDRQHDAREQQNEDQKDARHLRWLSAAAGWTPLETELFRWRRQAEPNLV